MTLIQKLLAANQNKHANVDAHSVEVSRNASSAVDRFEASLAELESLLTKPLTADHQKKQSRL